MERGFTMGQRANLIIVQNNSYDLYYSHWCANTLPTDLFWGPQYAIAFIEMQTKVDESGWLNDVWAEGGVVLDLGKKKLLFYGGEDILYDVSLRRLLISLMQITWHGWEIKWANEGITDLASYVGYPIENVLTEHEIRTIDLVLAPPEEKDWVDTVASVRFSDDEVLLFPLYDGFKVLSIGPRMVEKINKSYGYRQIRLSEWTHNFPLGGFHINIPDKRVEFWHSDAMPNIFQHLSSAWSDWTVLDNESNYESQASSTNGQLEFQTIDSNRLLVELRTLLLKESPNPLDALSYIVKLNEEAGKTVEINPNAMRNGSYTLPWSVREEILDYAIGK
jgi:hypothetical protein